MVTEKQLLVSYEKGVEQGINHFVIWCSLSGCKAWEVANLLSCEVLTVLGDVMPSG
jgi:hypothetical protein